MAKTIKKETIHAAGIDIGIYTTDFKNDELIIQKGKKQFKKIVLIK